jgi:hypothetical protein
MILIVSGCVEMNSGPPVEQVKIDLYWPTLKSQEKEDKKCPKL